MKLPFMSIAVTDVLATTGSLDTEEFGAFMLLQLHMWVEGGTLPKEDRALARCARLSMTKWKRIKPRIWPMFTVTGPGGTRITQNRLLYEYKRAEEKSSRNAANGKRGGQANARRNRNLREADARRSLRQQAGETNDIPEPDDAAPIPTPNNNTSAIRHSAAREGGESGEKALEEGADGTNEKPSDSGRSGEGAKGQHLIETLNRRAQRGHEQR